MQKRHRLAAISVAAGLIGGGAVGLALGVPGIASGQTTTSTTTKAAAARDQYLQSVLAPLVKNGTITQAQADAVIKALDAAKPEHGFGHFGMMKGGGDVFAAAAKKIGVSTDALRSALESGKTIADVANSKNVKPSDVAAAMVAAAKADLDQAVKDGKLTSTQEANIVSKLTTEMNDIVNGTARGPMGFGHHFGGPGFFGHRDRDGNSDSGNSNGSSGTNSNTGFGYGPGMGMRMGGYPAAPGGTI